LKEGDTEQHTKKGKPAHSDIPHCVGAGFRPPPYAIIHNEVFLKTEINPARV
jgi:hypothetical protein